MIGDPPSLTLNDENKYSFGNTVFERSQDIVVCMATGHRLDDSGRFSSPCRGKNFLFFMSSRLVLGLTQRPNHRVPGAFSPG
jgi:hypothetical protein